MLTLLTRNWWLVVLRGVCAVLFGLGTILWPDVSLLVLVLLFGGYALADGVFSLIGAARSSDRSGRWWALLLQGITGIATAAVTMLWPGITALALLYLIAAWAIITGALEIMVAFRLRESIENEWILMLAGIASVAFGIGIGIFPGAGALAVLGIIAGFALLYGVLEIALGFRLKALNNRIERELDSPLRRAA